MTSLDPTLYFARLTSGTIALDVRRDRYLRLSAPIAEAVEQALSGQESAETRARLAGAGLLGVGASPVQFSRILPCRATHAALSELGNDEPSLRVRIACVAALARMRTLLRIAGFASALARAQRAVNAPLQHDLMRAIALARAFEHARAWLPFERRCLPDGLALHALLARSGLRATLALGVRDKPFAAHCWVQAGDWLLTDTIDEVDELTPILVI
ncbi:lasso peptide biosynthesis B2 protein [Sphingomonas donggukensis]|uniref:Lasso peptide biosynthesis B2 protein n=1 Tax=Sphingomonas donggukensis TaxID=2949093 RepID=A0ABY4TU08_9SPHN|nr:lasso peptide biosynthesis B2 protein [Sphingomonas donggukensis]URW75890.1 lasso peptide biosynthesis B2 protein [Sphingomonas donggukensis]